MAVVVELVKAIAPEKIVAESIRETPVKTSDAILHVLKKDGSLTLAEVAGCIGKSVRAVERAAKN